MSTEQILALLSDSRSLNRSEYVNGIQMCLGYGNIRTAICYGEKRNNRYIQIKIQLVCNK